MAQLDGPMARSNNSTARTQNYDAPECGAADHSSIWVRLARARSPITSSILPRGSVVTLIGPRASRARAPRSQPPDREGLPKSALEPQRARRPADSSPRSGTAIFRLGLPLAAVTKPQSATRRCRGRRGLSLPHPAGSRTCGNSPRISRETQSDGHFRCEGESPASSPERPRASAPLATSAPSVARIVIGCDPRQTNHPAPTASSTPAAIEVRRMPVERVPPRRTGAARRAVRASLKSVTAIRGGARNTASIRSGTGSASPERRRTRAESADPDTGRPAPRAQGRCAEPAPLHSDAGVELAVKVRHEGLVGNRHRGSPRRSRRACRASRPRRGGSSRCR